MQDYVELAKKIEFVDSTELNESIFSISSPKTASTDWYIKMLRGKISETSIRTPSLTHEEERILFLKYNMAKKKAFTLANNAEVTEESKVMICNLLKFSESVRASIISHYLAMAINMSNKFVNSSLNFEDCLSDANMSLIKAIDRFDVSKGNRFSTYAYYAIQNDLIKLINDKKDQNSITMSEYIKQEDASFDDFGEKEQNENIERIEQVSEYLNDPEVGLTQNERTCVILRYMTSREQTLIEVGEKLGKSREWVRLQENSAFAKIRLYVKKKMENY